MNPEPCVNSAGKSANDSFEDPTAPKNIISGRME